MLNKILINNELKKRFAHLNFTKRKSAGFTLIEVIAAIFVITVGMTGALLAIQGVMRSTESAKFRLVANYLAQEGIEIVRNIRDGNWLEGAATAWDEGLTGCINGCEIDYDNFNNPTAEDPILDVYQDRFLKINAAGFYNYTSGDDTKFKRKITITGAGDQLDVSVEVTWDTHSVTAQEYFFNWKK